jgi:hypothetical protein
MYLHLSVDALHKILPIIKLCMEEEKKCYTFIFKIPKSESQILNVCLDWLVVDQLQQFHLYVPYIMHFQLQNCYYNLLTSQHTC